jgi:hypothetical protein
MASLQDPRHDVAHHDDNALECGEFRAARRGVGRKANGSFSALLNIPGAGGVQDRKADERPAAQRRTAEEKGTRTSIVRSSRASE